MINFQAANAMTRRAQKAMTTGSIDKAYLECARAILWGASATDDDITNLARCIEQATADWLLRWRPTP